MYKGNTILKYISDELKLGPIEKVDEIKAKNLAKKLNIEIDRLKEKIIQLFNEEINNLNKNEIILYYSVYLYLTQEKKVSKKEIREQNIEDKMGKTVEHLVKCYKSNNLGRLKEKLNFLNKKHLAKLIYGVYYSGWSTNLYVRHNTDEYYAHIKDIDKQIVIDIIINSYMKNNNSIKDIFDSNTLTNGNRARITFLKSVNYKDYLEFKYLIFTKKYKKDTLFYIILQEYIRTTKFTSYLGEKKLKNFGQYYKKYRNKNKGIRRVKVRYGEPSTELYDL